MNLINLNDKSFTIDGFPHLKKYELVKGVYVDTVSLVSIYNKEETLFKNTNYQEIQIDGATFNSVIELVLAFEDLKPNFNSGGGSPQLTANELLGIQNANDLNETNPAATINDTLDIYSINERIVGASFDGKPIYQKTFTGSGNFFNNEDVVATIPNLKNVLKMEGDIITDNSYYGIDNAQFFQRDAVDVYLYNNAVPGISVYILTLKYTKTTD